MRLETQKWFRLTLSPRAPGWVRTWWVESWSGHKQLGDAGLHFLVCRTQWSQQAHLASKGEVHAQDSVLTGTAKRNRGTWEGLLSSRMASRRDFILRVAAQ